MKRVKWEPAALMALVLGLGLWIAFGPAGRPQYPITPGALTSTVRFGSTRGVLEAARPAPDAEYAFRLWMPGKPDPEWMNGSAARALFGGDAVDQTIQADRNLLFRTLNITSWASVVWVAIGLLGQLAFSGRMVLQWIVSERRRESVITESFWWFSLFGGVTLFSYFVWRQDPIGILGQASGIVIYIRNLRLFYKRKRRLARTATATAAVAAPMIEPKPAAGSAVS